MPEAMLSNEAMVPSSGCRAVLPASIERLKLVCQVQF
jgi:hypothetical protein